MQLGVEDQELLIASFGLSTLAMIGWYLRFKLPFSAFLTGILALATLYSVTSSVGNIDQILAGQGLDALFNLGDSPVFATSTLAFGIAAFLVGMRFDMADPHRIGDGGDVLP